MEPPRRFLDLVLEICVVLALCAFLLRLAVYFLQQIWQYLLIAAIAAIIAAIGWRVYKFYHSQEKW